MSLTTGQLKPTVTPLCRSCRHKCRRYGGSPFATQCREKGRRYISEEWLAEQERKKARKEARVALTSSLLARSLKVVETGKGTKFVAEERAYAKARKEMKA